MRRSNNLAALLLVPLLAVGCSGNPPPEPVPAEPAATTPPPLPRDDAAEREAAASRICDRATAAMEAGDYSTARQLLQQVLRDYPGTSCAERAPGELRRAETMEALTARIHFEFNLATITDESAAVLQRKADALRANPNVMITIEGHCDERGSLEYNQALGMRRAQAARAYLVSLGLAESRFRVVTFGEERPLSMGSNEGAWRQNRRDEFVITAGDI
jgi:peptidoglycan-associated lipoprotein